MLSKILVLATLAACGTTRAPQAPTPAPAPTPTAGLRLELATIYVDDQDKALRFYTEVLGFTKHTDETNGEYRWLTVGAPNGVQLLLASNADPAAKAFQQAMFAQQQPAVMFNTSDLKADYERIKARGGAFTGPPTDVGPATIATLPDTCGNLVQLTQLTP